MRRVAVKFDCTLKKRLSSSKWHHMQSMDVYSKAARIQKYRCRSAFKLLQIEDSFNVFSGVKRVVDFGAAPGSWSQVAVQKVRSDPSIIQVLSVDVMDYSQVPGAHHLTKTSIEDTDVIEEAMHKLWEGRKPQLVLSDMLHRVAGEGSYDHVNSIKLCSQVLKFSLGHLQDRGSVVMKIYQGPHEKDLVLLLEKYFRSVTRFKPAASRSQSREHYLVSKGFRRGEAEYKAQDDPDDYHLTNELD